MHPHSLYPYLTVNPPLSLLLVLLAHCVSRIPSLRALTHPLHSPPFLPLRAARCMKQIEYSMGDKKKCGGRCQLLGYMAVISAMCPTTTGRPPPPPPPLPPLSERCTVRGSALLCWTSHPPSVLSRLDVFPAALCDCASRWYHNSHGFHARRRCGLIGLCSSSGRMKGRADGWMDGGKDAVETIIRRTDAQTRAAPCPSVDFYSSTSPVVVCHRRSCYILAFNGEERRRESSGFAYP